MIGLLMPRLRLCTLLPAIFVTQIVLPEATVAWIHRHHTNQRCDQQYKQQRSPNWSEHRIQQAQWSMRLFSSSSRNEEQQQRQEEHMKLVRSLQQTFYNTQTTASEPVTPNSLSGTVDDLPLWRVNWTELPGRTNVLSVHEPMYTHMFEQLLRTNQTSHPKINQPKRADQNNQEHQSENGVERGWYFGHVCHNTKPNDKHKVRLRAWNEEQEDDSNPVVLGTLMRITDFRRMQDGKLLLLVQAIERFCISEVVQQKPYDVAHVQLLPDREEIRLLNDDVEQCAMVTHADGSRPPTRYLEATVRPARVAAIEDSWYRWFPYEFECTSLPMRSTNEYVEVTDVLGTVLQKVLPYAPLDARYFPTEGLPQRNISLEPGAATETTSSNSGEQEGTMANNGSPEAARCHNDKPLEVHLLEAGILREVDDVPKSLLELPLAELEFRLWLAVGDYLVHTRTPVSPVLLGLLPPKVSWPADFLLQRIADTLLLSNSDIPHKYVRVSSDYPAVRRQKRLAYHAAHVLEKSFAIVSKQEFRQTLLQIPSIKLRLAYVLWKFEVNFGTFQ